MIEILAQGATEHGLRIGVVGLTFAFGLRHGVDWDHIAAITDIAGSQETSRRSMLFASLYALGHGAVVFVLGVLAILAGDRLPDGVDAAMERLVGVTLLVLGAYVFYALIRHGRDFRMRSRWMLIFAGVRRGARFLRRRLRSAVDTGVVIEHDHEHEAAELHPDREPAVVAAGQGVVRAGTHRHRHRHLGQMPEDPFMNYGVATSLGVGAIHGVGAETPTQVLVFLTAAGAAGPLAGVTLLAVFLFGLFVSNSAIALASTFSFLNSSRSFVAYATIAVLTGIFSIGVGAVFLFGQGEVLPAFFG